MNQLNILFIFCDQLRADALGKDCGGTGWVNTPSLDRVGREAIRFERAYTNSPVCVPARMSMATGLYPHSHGYWSNNAPGPIGKQSESHALDPEWPTWMSHIRDSGYRTALFGKTHLHQHIGDLRDREDLMKAYGWDHIDEIGGPRASARIGSHMNDVWKEAGLQEAYIEDYRDRYSTKIPPIRPSVLPLELYADTYVGQRAKSWLEDVGEDQPWMTWVSFGGPHEPWDTPEPYASKYAFEDMPSPLPLPSWMDEQDVDCSHRRSLRKWKKSLDGEGGMSEEHIKKLRANYAGNVELIDNQVGQILETLESRGLMENTIIVFSADHGEMNGDMGMLHKGNFFESACRIPFLIRIPKLKKGGAEVSLAPVELMDIGATLCDLVNLPWEGYHFSRSLKAHIEGKEAGPSLAMSEHAGDLMICDGKYKMIVNPNGDPCLLFDLESDPGESTNILGIVKNIEIQSSLEKLWAKRMLSTQLQCPGPRGYIWQMK